MDKFLQDISSSYWWLGVVLVGVVINILSSYLRRLMENNFSKFSQFWQTRRQSRIDDFNRRVDLLKKDADLKFVYALRESRYRIRAIGFLIFGLIFFDLGFLLEGRAPLGIQTLPMIAALITLMLGLDDHLDAMKVKKLVDTATVGLKDLEP